MRKLGHLVAAILATATIACGMFAAPVTAQAATSADQFKLVLRALNCHSTEDTLGPDEAYLLVNGRRVWGPESINDDDTEDLHKMEIPFNTAVQIKLYDQDTGWFDNDDFLGQFIATPEMEGQDVIAPFREDGANYDLYLTVERI